MQIKTSLVSNIRLFLLCQFLKKKCSTEKIAIYWYEYICDSVFCVCVLRVWFTETNKLSPNIAEAMSWECIGFWRSVSRALYTGQKCRSTHTQIKKHIFYTEGRLRTSTPKPHIRRQAQCAFAFNTRIESILLLLLQSLLSVQYSGVRLIGIEVHLYARAKWQRQQQQQR